MGTYTYAVADDYSKSNFQAEESSDGAGNAQGSYSVALPDGRIQHVAYTANGYDGMLLMSPMTEPPSTPNMSQVPQSTKLPQSSQPTTVRQVTDLKFRAFDTKS